MHLFLHPEWMGTRTDKFCPHYKAIYSVKGQIRIRIMARTYGKHQSTDDWSQRQTPHGPTKPHCDAVWWTCGEKGQVKGNLQLSHVLGNPLGQHPQPFVAAANHGVHAGTLGRTRRGEQAAALIITCTGERQRGRKSAFQPRAPTVKGPGDKDQGGAPWIQGNHRSILN